MAKIALIGDSIRMNYSPKVIEQLGDGCEVWQPAENCRFSLYTLRGMWDWRAQLEGTDIIHWNNGLWDICELFDDGAFTPKEFYIETMLRIAGIMQKKAKKVIFATTTPVKTANPHDKNERIVEYNEALVPKLREIGVIINDLHSIVAADVDTYICEDNLHLSDAGKQVCADAVVKAIREAEASL